MQRAIKEKSQDHCSRWIACFIVAFGWKRETEISVVYDASAPSVFLFSFFPEAEHFNWCLDTDTILLGVWAETE